MKNVPSIIDGIEFAVNGQIKVSSVELAGKFGKDHKSVLASIKNMKCSADFRERNFKPSSYKTKQNKNSPMFMMTEKGMMFLAMGFTGEEAAGWKIRFIDAFEKMAEFVKAEMKRAADRKLSAMEAPGMSDALKEIRAEAGKDTKGFHYANEFDLIYRVVLGASRKQWCALMEIEKNESLRDNLLPVQIEAVQNLQTANTVLIETGMEYKTRKIKLEKIFQKKFSERCLNEIVEMNK